MARIISEYAGFIKEKIREPVRSGETGIIAVACLLNLAPGGYEMRELNIPARCMLLDYCGCKKHRHPTGIAADLVQDELLKMVELLYDF